jgi:hypothetical protein
VRRFVAKTSRIDIDIAAAASVLRARRIGLRVSSS